MSDGDRIVALKVKAI